MVLPPELCLSGTRRNYSTTLASSHPTSPRLTSISKWVGDPDYTFTTWQVDRSVQVGAAAWVVDGRGTAPAGGQPPDK